MQYFGTGLEVGGSDPFTSVAPGSGETLYSGSVGTPYVAPSAPEPYVPPYVPPLLPPTGDPEQPPQIVTDPPRTTSSGGCRTCGPSTPSTTPPGSVTVTPGGGGAGGTVVVPSAGVVQVDSAREVRADTAPMTPARQAANLLWLIFISMGLIWIVVDN